MSNTNETTLFQSEVTGEIYERSEGADCTQSAEKVKDSILTEVLDRIEATSMGVHGILHDLGIDVYDDKYAPMFTNLLALAVEKYDDQKWRSL